MLRLDYIEQHKYDATNKVTGLGGIDIETTFDLLGITTTCIYSATFGSYNEARHYFNSGGTIW